MTSLLRPHLLNHSSTVEHRAETRAGGGHCAERSSGRRRWRAPGSIPGTSTIGAGGQRLFVQRRPAASLPGERSEPCCDSDGRSGATRRFPEAPCPTIFRITTVRDNGVCPAR